MSGRASVGRTVSDDVRRRVESHQGVGSVCETATLPPNAKSRHTKPSAGSLCLAGLCVITPQWASSDGWGQRFGAVGITAEFREGKCGFPHE